MRLKEPHDPPQLRDVQPLTLIRILSRVLLVLIGVGLAFALYRWAGGGEFFSWGVATPYSPLVAVLIGGVSAALVGLWVLKFLGKFNYRHTGRVLKSISLVWVGFGAGLFGPAALIVLISISLVWVGFAAGLFGPAALGISVSWADPGQGDEDSEADARESDEELLRFAFVDPLATGTTLLTEPVTSLADLRGRLDALFINVSDFWTLGERIEITGHSRLLLEDGPPVLKVTFELDGLVRNAYAYGALIEPEAAPMGAALLIPGSGFNQGLAIAESDSDNYHCGMWDALEGFGKFALIKPNEDARAIHDGSGKLVSDFYVVDFLNRGGSYSASYIAEAAAITAFLKSHYGSIALLGLSQGGKAAVITSLLVEPDALVVSSGYSVVSEEQVHRAGAGSQIIIPGLSHRLEFKSLSRELQPPTLFTWGEEEVGTYAIDARDDITCRRTQEVERFHCLVHADGHVFPERQVVEFLQSVFRKVG